MSFAESWVYKRSKNDNEQNKNEQNRTQPTRNQPNRNEQNRNEIVSQTDNKSSFKNTFKKDKLYSKGSELLNESYSNAKRFSIFTKNAAVESVNSITSHYSNTDNSENVDIHTLKTDETTPSQSLSSDKKPSMANKPAVNRQPSIPTNIHTNMPKSSINPTSNSSIPKLSQTPLARNGSIKSKIIVKPAIKTNDPNLSRDIENLRVCYRRQNFWKYHIIKLSKNEFYLSTNPDKRHRFIRNAPSYFIKLEIPNDDNYNDKNSNSNKINSKISHFKNKTQIDKGFRLIFTQQQVIGMNGYDGNYKSFIVEKLPKSAGGNYKIQFQYNEFQEDWNIKNNINGDNFNRNKDIKLQFNKSNDENDNRDSTNSGNNDNNKNNKSTKKNKDIYDLKNNLTLADDYQMGEFLHVCCIKDKKKGLFIKNKPDGVKLAKPNSVYFLDTGFFKKNKWFDPVVCVFRPCNRDTKNKFTKSMLINSKFKNSSLSNIDTNNSNSGFHNSKKLFSAKKLSVDFSNINIKNEKSNGNDNDDGDDDDDDEFDYGEDENEEDEFSDNVVDLDQSSEPNLQKFYEAKDGFFNRHPKDDSPNDFKLGWITIFEKGRYFEKIPNAGNWQLVLGMTFAVGFEKIIDKYLKQEQELQLQ